MKLVTETTPTQKGSYAIVGSTIAICSPCCGSTDVYAREEKPVCRGCGKEIVIAPREKTAPRERKDNAQPKD